MEEEIREFQEYFSTALKDDVFNLIQGYPKVRSLAVDLAVFAQQYSDLAAAIMEKPDDYQKAAEEALRKTVEALGGQVLQGSGKPRVRFYNLPGKEILVQYLGAEHLNKLVQVQGVINLMTDIRPKMQVALWECTYCETTTKNYPDKSGLKPPILCGKCGKKEFVLLESTSDFVNTQYGQMQDLLERVQGSSTPSHIDVWFEDDLTNVVMPGETISITGVLRLMPRLEKGRAKSSIYGKAFDVVHVKKEEKEFEDISISKDEEQKILELSRNPRLQELIVGSIAPSIWGHKEVKAAIALQLFGGTPDKLLSDGSKVRSDIHVLLVGDPGVAKSQLLKFTELLAPKCIYVAGRGASGVGLTASAEKDKAGEGWVLKAGALVLASGGLVAIDEFDKMDKDDRANIHEALEQQQISIAKAGIVTRFKAKTSVLAAANPKLGRFDSNMQVADQFDIPPALLSRFDLIFTMRDVLDEPRDRKVAEHILKGLQQSAGVKAGTSEKVKVEGIESDLLRKYIAYARRTVFPRLTDEAMEKIKDYYLELRLLGNKTQTFPITARDLEGLVRLSEAMAKMRLSPAVELQDAEFAIALKDFVLKDVFVDKATGKLDTDVINLGRSHAKADRIRTILNVIRELERQVDLVETNEVLKRCVESGLDEQEAMRVIEELKRQGELYSPKAGFLKTAVSRTWKE
ncbi:TPA: minichromosome maintenance protein MCM [Candidatus Micrarchaeota archaeon]|nr:minichromosome maintenance protein MCM [Candidatus Micrarchaeota archaeon]